LKNKKNIKILLPLVIIIWGLLIYNIYDAFYPESPSISKNKSKKYKAPKVKEKDTFSLLPIKNDPFLGTMYQKSKRQQTNTNIKKVNQNINWPTITYQGIVSDKNAKSNVYIVNLNGMQYLLKKGDTIQNIKVLKSSSNTLRIQFKGQTKDFPIM